MTLYPPLLTPVAIAMQGARDVTMTADQYLFSILARERVDMGPTAPALVAMKTLQPIIAGWAGTQLENLFPSGSFAKGTGNSSGTDIDIFVSLKSDTNETLREIYDAVQ